MVIKWGIRNIVSFNIEKMETILFTIIRINLLIKLAEDNKFSIESKKIKFNINAIRWLSIILDLGLKLKTHVD